MKRRFVPPHEELVGPDFASPVGPSVRRFWSHKEEGSSKIHDFKGEEKTDPGEGCESS